MTTGRLARAVRATVEHGPARSRVRRWIRWLPGRSRPVDPRFQDGTEPFPGHWRSSPARWPEGTLDDPDVRRRLHRALAALPATWRAVLLARDAENRPAGEVAAELDLTAAQERRLLGRARAALRDAVTDASARPPDPPAGR